MTDSDSNNDGSSVAVALLCGVGAAVFIGYSRFSSELQYQDQTIATQQQKIQELEQQKNQLQVQLTQSEARYQGYREGRR